MAGLEFFVYNHEEREFSYFNEDRSRLEEVMLRETPEEIAEELDGEGIDGILVLDESGGRWYLAFAASLGIVGQRTARRQADTIVRSGYTLPDGYWLKAKYPMDELSDPNLGDLWKTVQQKYVKDSSLTGLELDEELGIPKQLAERAKEMKASGHSDDLTEARLEKEEAAERSKAKQKSEAKPKKGKSKKKAKKAAKKEKEEEEEEKKPAKKKKAKKSKAKKKKATKSKAKKKAKKESKSYEGTYFLEVNELAEYLENNSTVVVGKGSLTSEEGDEEASSIIFHQDVIKKKVWNNVVIFLEEEDVVELTVEERDGEIYALTVNK